MQTQTWRPREYNQHAQFVSSFGVSVVELLDAKPGEQILDLGCGEGALAEQLKEIGAEVIGVDSSPAMIEAARARGIDARVMSGDRLTFKGEFDAVFSNAALHWVLNYEDVIQGVYASLKPGGRFVGEFGGAGNIKCIVNAMNEVMSAHPEFGKFVNPWFFPTAEVYAAALTREGFRVVSAETFPRPTPLANGVGTWLRVFADHVISGLRGDQATRFLEQVEELVRPDLYTPECGWMADYVRLRFVATKP